MFMAGKMARAPSVRQGHWQKLASSDGSMAMTLWQLAVLPLSATDVHEAPSLADTIATYAQHVIRPAQTPLAAPLLLPLPEPPLLPAAASSPAAPLLEPPPPSGEHCESHIADSQSNVGPSQTSQLIVSHCASGVAHMLSMQSTHSVLYPPNTIDDGQTHPLVSMLGPPELPDEDPPPLSSPEPSTSPPPLDPEPPPPPEELLVVPGSPWASVPFEPPHATPPAMTANKATATPAHARPRKTMGASHLGYCRQGRHEAIVRAEGG
jgi:hypothetical protein